MAFSAGTALCCAQNACVLLDTTPGASDDFWEIVPHVTEISFTQTANTTKLVTSSTDGLEVSVCGTVSQTGTLAIACHNGVGPLFCINQIYHIQWALLCDNLFENPIVDPYYEARIRITSVPVQMQISSNAAVIFSYNFEIVSWQHYPDCQAADIADA